MNRAAALLPLALLLAACTADARPAATWAAPTVPPARAVYPSPTALPTLTPEPPGYAATQQAAERAVLVAQVTAGAIASDIARATGQAQATDDAHRRALVATSDELAVIGARVALSATQAAATATQAAVLLRQAGERSAATATAYMTGLIAGGQSHQAAVDATRVAGTAARQEAQDRAAADSWALVPYALVGGLVGLLVVLLVFTHNLLTVQTWRRTIIETRLGPVEVSEDGARLLPSPDEPDWGGDAGPAVPLERDPAPPLRVNGEDRPDLPPLRDPREQAAREACVEFLTDCMRLEGRRSPVIPSKKRLRMTANTWQARVDYLRRYVVTDNTGTRLTGEFPTLFDLRTAVGDGRAQLEIPRPAAGGLGPMLVQSH